MTLATPVSDEVSPWRAPSGRVATSWQARVLLVVATHRLFTTICVVAAALRLVVLVAYAPALEFFGDSGSYLNDAQHPFHPEIWHPSGYPLFLWVLSITHSLAVVTLLQHAMGIVAAVLVYRLVRAFSVGAVGGTIAAVPLLLDGYQIDVEQFVLSDTMFTLLIAGAMTLAVQLLREPSHRTAAALGGVLAAATLTRTAGEPVGLAVLAVLLLARVGWRRVATAAAAFAVPLGLYAVGFHANYGVYGLQGYSGRYLYGIVGQFADCDPAALPVDERRLCPTLPKYARPGVNQYVWNEYVNARLPGSPVQRSQLAGQFGRRILLQQPGDLAAVAAGNLLHYFAPDRTSGPRDWYVGAWQFPTTHRAPAWNVYPTVVGFNSAQHPHGRIDNGIAHVLRGYQRFVFTPGAALLLAIGVAGVALCLRRRDRVLRATIATLGGSGLALLALPSVTAGFDWRYLLPAQALLAPAGVLGASLLREPLRRLLRRALPVAVGAVVVATLAPGLATSTVFADTQLEAARTAPVPATLPIGDAATVRIGKPTIVGSHCWPDERKRPRLIALVAFPVAVTYRSGSPLLVQQGNFDVSNGWLTTPGIPVAGATVPNVLLSARHPVAKGTLYTYVDTTTGRLRYVDPLGAGGAAWRFSVSSPDLSGPLGSRCTGATPWSGQTLPYLHVTGVRPFTQEETLPFGYGLGRQAWRADSYDVRFRVGSPTQGWGPWQQPKLWQHTELTRQSLLRLTPGLTYCLSVRARDALNAVTAWSEPTCTARLYDDGALPQSPGWLSSTGVGGFSMGTSTATQQQNAAISIAGTFSRVALTVYRCPTCGQLAVYVGPRLVKTLDLASTPPATGLVTWTSPSLGGSVQSTVTLKVLSKDKVVAIDSFGLLR